VRERVKRRTAFCVSLTEKVFEQHSHLPDKITILFDDPSLMMWVFMNLNLAAGISLTQNANKAGFGHEMSFL
jgi:hypothetical protein